MSTPEENREPRPDPVDIVTRLQQSVDELFAASEALQQDPTDEKLYDFYAHASNVKLAATPILTERFFHATENDLLIGIGVESVVSSGNNLYERSRAIVGESVGLAKFSDELNERLSNSLITKDMATFGAVQEIAAQELNDEQIFEVVSTAIINQVDEHFSKIVDQYVDIVINNGTVAAYYQQQQLKLEALAERAIKRAEKIKNAKLLGGFMVIAIVGPFLANKLSRD